MNHLPARFVLWAVAMASTFYALISAFTFWDTSADVACVVSALTFTGWWVCDIRESRR